MHYSQIFREYPFSPVSTVENGFRAKKKIHWHIGNRVITKYLTFGSKYKNKRKVYTLHITNVELINS